MESLREYVYRKTKPGTATRYLRETELFFSSIENPKEATYSEIMNYLGKLREKNNSHVQRALYGLKMYYNYLLDTGQRKDHPCRYITLRDHRRKKDIQLQDLFRPEELELLLNRKERYSMLKNRNLVVTGLLIYQGLMRGEIQRLKTYDIDLEEGTVHVQETDQTNGRILKLKANQALPLYKYINEDRPNMLREETDQLIINKLGRKETGEGIGYVIETQKHLFSERILNCKTIRQSVITNLLKEGKDLRLVQAFAGHKTPSTTERYKQTHVEQLKQQILKHHPLDSGGR